VEESRRFFNRHVSCHVSRVTVEEILERKEVSSSAVAHQVDTNLNISCGTSVL
jgi:hypothetical protein